MAEKLRRAEAGEPQAFSGEVGLVGVSGDQGQTRQIGLGARGEAAEAEHPLDRLGPITGRYLEAAAKLALAEAQLTGELVHALARVQQANHGGLDGEVRRSVCDQPARGSEEQRGDTSELGVAAELFAGIQADVGEADAAVTQLLQRYAERGSPRSGQEPNAEDQLASFDA